jgi:tripeptidyl-peptidase-1
MLSAVGVCTASTILHRRSCDPDGFVYNGPALDEHVIEIRLALASSNIQGLRDDLNAITNPSSPRFRQWLSHDQATLQLAVFIME